MVIPVSPSLPSNYLPSVKKTKIKLIHEGLETFTNPEFSKSNFEAGWKYLIHESLKELLEKGKALRYW